MLWLDGYRDNNFHFVEGHDLDLSPALESLVNRFQGFLKATGRRFGFSTAEIDELTQEIRIRLWRALKDREKIVTAKSFYVQRTARSAAVDLIRRRRARQEDSLDEAMARLEQDRESLLAIDQHGREGEAAEIRARLASALKGLAAPRDVVVRLHLSGYERHEIAALLGWTEPKVRNLLYRGLDDLRAELEAQGAGVWGIG